MTNVVRNEVDLLLDRIFTQVPVITPNAFILSAVAQVRRTLDQHRSGTIPAPPYDFPAWLQGHALGPYESRLLAQLLYSPGPVVVLRGGTGSGKSSVLGYLTRHVNAAAERLGTKRPAVAYTRFFVLVDVQTLTGTRVDSEEPNPEDVRALLGDLAKAMLPTLKQLRDDDLGRVLLEALDDRPDDGPSGIRQMVMSDLRRRCDPPVDAWQSLSGRERFDLLRHAIDELSPGDQLTATLALFRGVHQLLNDGDVRAQEWPLVVILDNVDPLASAQQSALLQKLATLTSGPAWGNMRIAIGMRLSTYEQNIGAIPFNKYDHHATDPAEIVLLRTTLALLAPTALEEFKRLTPANQDLAYATILELFVHLVDRGGYFSELLSSMCGTNIRHALGHAHRWCLSIRVQRSAETKWRRAEFQGWLRSVLASAYLEDVAVRLGHGVMSYLREVAQVDDVTELNLERITTDLRNVVARVIESADVTKPIEVTDTGPRSTIAKILREGFAEEIRKSVPDSVANTTLCRGIRAAVEWCLEKRVPSEMVDAICSDLISYGAARANEQNEVLALLYGWVAEGIRRSTGRSAREWVRVRRAKVPDLSTDPVPEPEASRYLAESLLLQSRNMEGMDVPQALNVFSLDGRRACPVALRILYLLRFCGDAAVTRQRLLEALRGHGYSLEEIQAAISEAMSLSRRLIYSGVRDEFQGMDAWLRAPQRVVRLSSAGMAYLNTLLRVPAYLQWALRHVSDGDPQAQSNALRARSVRDRLATALQGFERVIGNEKGRIEQAWRDHKGASKVAFMQATELQIQNASADSFFKALDPFMHVYETNVRIHAERRSAEASALEADAAGWVALAKKTIEEHRRIFDRPVPSWATALAAAESDLDRIRRRSAVMAS
jgi:hypothetical protein